MDARNIIHLLLYTKTTPTEPEEKKHFFVKGSDFFCFLLSLMRFNLNAITFIFQGCKFKEEYLILAF